MEEKVKENGLAFRAIPDSEHGKRELCNTCLDLVNGKCTGPKDGGMEMGFLDTCFSVKKDRDGKVIEEHCNSYIAV